jgi:transcriptional regulator with XRE-family HTH domain
MAIGPLIQAWRLSRQHSIESLSEAAGLDPSVLEGIEADQQDPSSSTLQAVANALRVPAPWLFQEPQAFASLFEDQDEDDNPLPTQADPVTERILTGSRMDRSLYVLLTALMQAGDPKLLRAAEVSLRSLVKQSRQATVPWQQRPSGHFEPPSD